MSESGSEEESTPADETSAAAQQKRSADETVVTTYEQMAIAAARDYSADYAAYLASYSGKVEKARKYLLIASLAGLVVGQTNLVPTQISALGISFKPHEQQNFKYIIIAVIAYFMALVTQLLLEAFFRSINNDVKQVSFFRILSERAWLLEFEKAFRYTPQWLKVFNALLDFIVPYTAGILGILALLHKLPSWIVLS